ncbi:MAG: lipopolysaccharide biosynthesis protein [Anaerolineae bacterium]
MSQSSLTRKVASSAFWTYFSYVLSKSAAFLTTMVLTRLLTQAEFGIVGFALTTMSFIDTIRDIGLSVVLVRRRDDVEAAADTVFWSTLVSNVILWAVLSLASPLIADFFHEPQIIQILPIISFTFILSSLGSTHDALLQRDMGFGKRFVPTFGASIIKSLVSIGLALAGLGVWGLVWGQLASRAAFTVLAWRAVPSYRPRRRFSWPILRTMMGDGLKISFDSFLGAVQANIDYVFIGHFLGDVSLGLYTVAFRVPELIVINLAVMVGSVLYPAYASVQHDMDRLREAMLSALRYISIITVPIGVGLALVAPQFVEVAFGAEWRESAPIMSMLCLYGVLLTISWNIGDVYKAIGKADILWKTALIELLLVIPTLYFFAQQSAAAVGFGQVIVAFVVSLLRLCIAIYLLKVPVGTVFMQFIPAFAGAAAMTLVVSAAAAGMAHWSSLLTLLSLCVLGASTYIAVLYVFERPLFVKAAGEAQRRFGHLLPALLRKVP